MKSVKELYNQISERLNRINFELIWQGFKRYKFALYTSEKVLLYNKEIPWDNRFVGNTSIYYDEDYIAIWDVEHDFMNNESRDIDILAANIVHEMFHAYQQENSEKRWPNDLVTLKYPDNIENFNLKYEENKLLADAFEQKDLKEKRRLLNNFCSIRQNREALIGTMCKCEYLTETIEGMAEFAGMLALRMLSQAKYKEKVMSYVKLLRDFTTDQLNIRKISYYSGVILLLTAYEMNINFTHSISSESRTVFTIISQFLSPKLPEDLHTYDSIEKAMEEIKSFHKKEIEQFLEVKRIRYNGDFYISGYDPMNMFRVYNNILCKTFVILTDERTNESITLLGNTLLEMHLESENKVRSYFR